MKYKYLIFSTFTFSLIIQILAFNFFFNNNFQNVLNFSNDANVYYKALKFLKESLIYKFDPFIFFNYPFLNYPHIVINYIIELIFGDNQISYFIFNSLIFVFIYFFLIKISFFLNSTINKNHEFIIFFTIILNPFIYFISMIRGKDLIILLLFTYITYFIFYFNKYSINQIYLLFKKHIRFKFYIFLLLLSSIYLSCLRPQLSNIMILGILFYLFVLFFCKLFSKKNFYFPFYENISIVLILILGTICYELIIDFAYDKFDLEKHIYLLDSLRDFNNRSVHDGLAWEYLKYVPDFIEKIGFIISDKRYQLYSIAIENDAYLGVSITENFKIQNIIELIKSLPLIFFNSLFNLDMSVLEKNNLYNLIYFFYSFIVFISFSILITNLSFNNSASLLFASMYIISNLLIYFVTPTDGSFVRYKLSIDLILISYGIGKLYKIFVFILEYIGFSQEKDFLIKNKVNNLNTFFLNTSINFILILIFSILLIYREFLIFDNFILDSKLIKYFILMSFIGFLSSSLNNPIIDTLSSQIISNKFDITYLLFNTLKGLLIFFIFIAILLTFFETLFIDKIYSLENYVNEFIFLKISFIIFSIPVNAILSSYLIHKNKSYLILVSQLIVPLFFILYFKLFGVNSFNYLYFIIACSVFLNFIILLILCMHYGFNLLNIIFLKFNFLEFKFFLSSLYKNILNNFYIPFILLTSLIIVSNFNQAHLVYYGFSIRFLNLFYSIFVILFTSSIFPYFKKNDASYKNEKSNFYKLTLLLIPLFLFILLIYPFIYLTLEPILDYFNFNFDLKMLFENIIFILFIIPIFCITSLISKFYIYQNKELSLLYSNLLSLLFSFLVFIIFKLTFTNLIINHFVILTYIITNMLIFSSFFLFEKIRYKSFFSAFIILVLLILFLMFYVLINNYSHIIIFTSLAIIISFSIMERSLKRYE